MWNVKAKVILVTAGTTGTTSKPFTKYLNSILVPGRGDDKKLQKAAILSTEHKLRNVRCTNVTLQNIQHVKLQCTFHAM
jgi:hypothetical protein